MSTSKTTPASKAAPPQRMQSSPYSPPKSRGHRPAVLHLCADLDAGDPARETVDLAILTQRSGWRALIASHGGSLVIEAERAAVRHARMPLNRHNFLASWRNRVQLEALVQRERPSLLHAHGMETLTIGYNLSRSHRLPLIVDLTQPPQVTPRNKHMLGQLKQISSYVRVPSEFMGHYLMEQFGLDPENIVLLPPGIDMQTNKAGSISAERLQVLNRLWRLPDQASVVLVPIPLVEGMGHKAFLQALAQMKNEKVYTVMVGSDRHAHGMRSEIEAMVNHLGLQGKVIMPENCTDWPAAFWLASVVVAPNIKPRGQNRSMLAAQAVGRPVIATDSGANREMVLDGETAWLVPPEDVKAMTAALIEAVQLDTNQRLELTHRTRDFIAASFPQSAWFDGMVTLYQDIMSPALRTKAA